MKGASLPGPASRRGTRLPLWLFLPLWMGCQGGGVGSGEAGLDRPPSPPWASGPPVSCRPVSPLLPLPAEVTESSGLVFSSAHPGVLWTHNDSGGTPELFAVDRDGSLLGRVRVTGARNRDWEDMAIGPCTTPEGGATRGGDCLYVADVGDNLEVRDDLIVYRVPEPHPDDTETSPADIFPVRLPHGPRDVEAIFLLPGEQLHLVTKGRSHPVEIYRYPGPLRAGEEVTLEPVQQLTQGPPRAPNLFTGGSAHRDGEWVALRTYADLRLYRVSLPVQLGQEAQVGQRDEGGGLLQEVQRVNLLPFREPQGEAVAFGPGDTLALSGEEGPGGVQRGSLAYLTCSGLSAAPS